MGASGWVYVVPYRADLAAVLAALRREVFAARDYYFVLDDDGRWPETEQELWADEHVRHDGTHSVLDVDRVVEPGGADDYGTVRPLRSAERLAVFGTAAPTRAEFERAYERPGFRHPPRGSAHCAALQDGEGPAEIAVWGVTGD